MANLAVTLPQPLLFNDRQLAAIGGVAGTILIVISRVIDNYAAEWIIGVPAILLLLLIGTRIERTVIVVLLGISVILGGDQMHYGFRQVVFMAVFMLFARYLVVGPLTVITLYLLGLVGWWLLQGEVSALFVVIPTIVPLLIAAAMRHAAVREHGRLQPGQSWRIMALSAVAFVFPWVGSGSRTAFFVWVVAAARRITIGMAIVGIIGAVAILSLPGLKMAEKIGGSIDELTTPVAEEGGAVSQRAIEGLIFITWLPTASVSELLIGSRETLYLPGDVLGRDSDPPFIPHNQLFGLVFQFGFIGLALVVWYLLDVWRHMRPFPEGRFLFFMLLIPGFITSGGFITPDFAVLAAVINGMMLRFGRPAAA